jgi:hypothetical protein
MKLLVLLIALTACAQTPRDVLRSSAVDEGATGSAAEDAVSTSKAATSRVSTTSASGASANAVSRPERQADAAEPQPAAPHGYHLVVRKGVPYYCSNEPALGTRVKSRKTCLTREQFEQARTDAQQKMREKQGQRQTWE